MGAGVALGLSLSPGTAGSQQGKPGLGAGTGTSLTLLVTVPALCPLGHGGSGAGTSRGPVLCHNRAPIAPCPGPALEGAASHGRRGELPASQLRRS